MSSDKTSPKYKIRQGIILQGGRIGFIDYNPHWNEKYKSWYYCYSYGLGGTSEGYVSEYLIDHQETKTKFGKHTP